MPRITQETAANALEFLRLFRNVSNPDPLTNELRHQAKSVLRDYFAQHLPKPKPLHPRRTRSKK